jgi:acyl dehydratase
MAGRYFEKFTIAEILRHDRHRTVTETENLLMTTLTRNRQKLHLDEEPA